MAFYVPAGLGIGINAENHTDPRAAWRAAVRALGPEWSHSWTPELYGPSHVPMLDPAYHGIRSARELAAWRDRQIARGLRWNELTWQFCNEPEASGVSERALASLVIQQIAEFDRADIQLRIIFPNGNINTKPNLDYTKEAIYRVYGQAGHVLPSVHIWCRPDELPWVWGNYRNWIGGFRAGRFPKVIITEAGPGPVEPMHVWQQFMPMAYRLLDDPIVGALAPFAAYPKRVYHANGSIKEDHPGFLDWNGKLNTLGRGYVEERSRREN